MNAFVQKEVVVAYFKKLSQHVFIGTKENPER